MSRLDTSNHLLSTLLAIVEANQPLEGRVRLQKTIYLLQQLGFAPLRRVRYAYHHYGPYSEAVAGALRTAVHSELIRETVENFDDEWQRFRYELNAAHPDLDELGLDPEHRTHVDRVCRATTGAHWRELELAATVIYLERNQDLARDVAFERALQLKPACAPFRERTVALLRRLEL